MAQVAKSGTPSLSSVLPSQNAQIVGLLAGVALAVGDICYIAADGTVQLSNGTAANALAKADGIVAQAAAIGEGVSLYRRVNFRYGAGLIPGTRLYVSATAGTLSDVATVGGTGPVGFVVDATRIHFHGSHY